jgi:hypothetical protein
MAAHKVISSPKHVKRKLQATSNASILTRSGDNMTQSTYVEVVPFGTHITTKCGKVDTGNGEL